MGWIRLIHFTTAYILLSRCCFVFTGHVSAMSTPGDVSGSVLAPRLAQRRYQRNPLVFFPRKEAHRYYGHNPVAGLAVMFYFWMSVLMVCSGFALYGEGLGTDSWAYQWFGWMIRLTGNDSLALHFWHRLGMWFIIAFVIAHVYTAIREDIMSRQSVISVMISGWRWFR